MSMFAFLRGIERAIQGQAGANQGEVCEGLGEIAERLPGRADLLGVEADVVAQSQQLLQSNARLYQGLRAGQRSHARQALDKPESAGAEGPFYAAFQPIVRRFHRIVAQD